MSTVSQCHEPGLLLVLTQPKSPAYLDAFNDWYNTEHGPLRMMLDPIENGYRYRESGSESPVWAGIYDLKRVSAVTEPQYTNLRSNRSPREQDIMTNKMDVLQRKIYKQLTSRGLSRDAAPVILMVTFVVRNELVDEVNRWYEQEHLEDLSKIPGWRRSRRFVVIGGDHPQSGCTELLAVHEFDQDNGLGGPEHVQARNRPWRNRVVALVENRCNTRFDFYHAFCADNYRAPPDPYISTASRPRTVITSERRPSVVALSSQPLVAA